MVHKVEASNDSHHDTDLPWGKLVLIVPIAFWLGDVVDRITIPVAIVSLMIFTISILELGTWAKEQICTAIKKFFACWFEKSPINFVTTILFILTFLEGEITGNKMSPSNWWDFIIGITFILSFVSIFTAKDNTAKKKRRKEGK